MGLKYTIRIDLVKETINIIALNLNNLEFSMALRKMLVISHKPQTCVLSLLLFESADKITDARYL
jgi:hypothetical protein